MKKINVKNYIVHANSYGYTGREVNEFIMIHKDSDSCARLYWYSDEDKQQICIAHLSVSVERRKENIGNELLSIVEEVARYLKFKSIYLHVLAGSWLQYWYERRGFKIDKFTPDNYEREDSFITMQKYLL